MTPEELNRTIEFIIQSQARLAAAQEQDREERVHFGKRLAGLVEVQVRLLESQTRRLDEYAKRSDEYAQRFDQYAQRFDEYARRFDQYVQENRAAQKRHEERHEEFLQFMRETRIWHQEFQIDAQKRHEEALARLDRILEKLTDRMN